VLDTYITFLMMACDTNDRAMIESMVKAIVTEYTPHKPAIPSPVGTVEKIAPPVKKIIPFRI
jgi:hypothetical protein